MFIFQTHCVSVLNMSQPPTPGSPVGARENGLLQAYFENLGQFAFDKARDIMVRNSLRTDAQLCCSEILLGQGPWPVARLAQLVEQRTSVPRVVGSSHTPGTNTFLPNVTLLVSEVIRMSAWRPEWQKGRECSEILLGQGLWPVARLAQLVEQRTGVPRVVGSSPTPGTNTFLPNVTLMFYIAFHSIGYQFFSVFLLHHLRF